MNRNVSLPPSPFTTPPLAGASSHCLKCGAEGRRDARYCWCCGTQLSAADGLQAVPIRPLSSKSTSAFSISNVLVALSMIGVIIVLLPLAATGLAFVLLLRTCIQMVGQ